jgi:hypothetical protein
VGYFEPMVAGDMAEPAGPGDGKPSAEPATERPAPALTRSPDELSDEEVGDALAAELRALELELPS